MSNLNSFTQPATFRRMNPEFLRRWLEPAREYLAGRGLALPPAASGQPLDYERLAAIFMEPDGAMPRELMHSAAMIHEMSTEPAMHDLLEGCRQAGRALQAGDDPDPVDVAMAVWLLSPTLLEELYQMHQLDRPRGFIHFVTDRAPDPGFAGPTEAAKARLEQDLAEWFCQAKRGRHAKVWMYRRLGEFWFLVRHGLASRRQEVLSATGADTLIFRPGEYDVLVYNRERGELRVHGCSPREVDLLRRLFGKHLFHDQDFFPGGARFTLAPLVERGRACLVCTDIAGIESITLTEVQVFSGGRDWLRVSYQAPDVFTTVEQEKLLLPEADLLVRASFSVRFSDSRKHRTIKLSGSNKLSVLRDGDTVLMERWLDARGFILKRRADEAEELVASV